MDDFLGKKKETAPILDLSKSTANTQEEFKKLYDKVPDFKIKPEKVPADSIKIRDKDFKFKTTRKDLKKADEEFTFMDPLPKEMRSLNLKDLAAVNIDWRMLTTLRPKTKLEENFFSRLVELKKLENKTRDLERRQSLVDPQIRKIKNKSGVVEMRTVNCTDCGEDFCNGIDCSRLTYDSCARMPEALLSPTKATSPDASALKSTGAKKKVFRKSRSRSKSKSERKSKKGQREKSTKRSKSPKKKRGTTKSPKKNKSSSKSPVRRSASLGTKISEKGDMARK